MLIIISGSQPKKFHSLKTTLQVWAVFKTDPKSIRIIIDSFYMCFSSALIHIVKPLLVSTINTIIWGLANASERNPKVTFI